MSSYSWWVCQDAAPRMQPLSLLAGQRGDLREASHSRLIASPSATDRGFGPCVMRRRSIPLRRERFHAFLFAAVLSLGFGTVTRLCGQTSPVTLPDLRLGKAATFMFDIAAQDDGKIIILGIFDSVNGVPANRI